MKTISNILFSAIALYGCAYLFDAVIFSDLGAVLIAAIILGIFSVTIKPLLKLLTLPLNILTLGLFGFIVNGLILYIVAMLTPGFDILTFWWAVLVSLVVTFFTTILQSLFGLD